MFNENSKIELCDQTIIHEDVVDKVMSQIPLEENLINLAELFKILGDSTRVKIFSALSISEMCVCDIAALLNMTQSAISHQLRILKQAGFISNRREGKVVFYSLDNKHVEHIFEEGLRYINKK